MEKSNKDEPFNCHIPRVNEDDYSVEEEPVITDEDFILAIRPEFTRLSETGEISATVYGAMPTGMESTLKLRAGDYLLTSVVFGSATYPIRQQVRMGFKGNGMLLYDRTSGKLAAAGCLADWEK